MGGHPHGIWRCHARRKPWLHSSLDEQADSCYTEEKELSQENKCDEENTLCVPGQHLPQPDGGVRGSKLHLLMDYTDRPGDVANPWYTGDFEATWQDVLAGCQGLFKELTHDKT